MAVKTGFWAQAKNDPTRIALIDAAGQSMRFGELDERGNRLSNGLRSLGLQYRDGIAMLMHNDPAWIEIFLATHQAGLYLTPINYHLTGPEVAYIIENCEAKAFIAHERHAAAAIRAVEALNYDRSRCFAVGNIPGFRSYDAFLAEQPVTPPAERQAGTLMLYTSGTTGRPKGVRRPLMPGNPDVVASMAGMLGALFQLSAGNGVHLVTGPLYHAAPGGFGSASLHMGHTLVLMDKWDAEETLRLIEAHRITSTHMVPTMFHRLLALPDTVKQRYDVSSLRAVIHGAAPIGVEAKKALIEWWGPVIYEYYGATEGGGTIATSEDWLKKPGTVGRPWPGTEIRIFDDAGNTLPAGEPGNVYMKSMVGEFEYYKDPAKTRESHRDGLFTVGDIGYVDDDGWLFLCDRTKDLIISGGVNIYPAEIEKALMEHPKVADAAVFGIPNEEWGEEIKAVIQPADGIAPGPELAEELMAFASERLARFKLPRSIDFAVELPRLDTGKLYKRFLRDPYWEGRERKI